VHDLGYELGTATAAGAGPTTLGDLGGRAGAVADTGSNFAVGDTVAVADDHERLGENSLLKVIVKFVF
jgi:hypothetical protein